DIRGAAQDVPQEARQIPPSIVGRLRALVPSLPGGNIAGLFGRVYDFDIDMDDLDAAARWIPWASSEVKARAEALEEQVLMISDGNPEEAPLVGGVFEYAVRLATLHAVSRTGPWATVTMGDWEWGVAWSLA